MIRGGVQAYFAGAESATPEPRAVLTSIGEVVYDWDLVSDTMSWGGNAADVLGSGEVAAFPSGDAFGLSIQPGSGATRHDVILAPGVTDHGSGVPYRTAYTLLLKGGRALRIEDSGRWYGNGEGRPATAHGVLRVLPRAAGEEPHVQIDTDRSAFLRQIGADLGALARSKGSLTLLVGAIDDLDRCNEEHGYEATDVLLEQAVRRMRGVMRRRDRFVRYSGNRFALALLSCPPDQVRVAAERLARAVESPPIMTPTGSIAPRLRIGAASAPDHAADVQSLMRRAEEALVRARASTCETFALYQPPVPASPAVQTGILPQRSPPTLDIVEALNSRRVTFSRQPVVEARGRALAFSEALMRVRGYDGRIVTAGDVLVSVEKAGLVPLVDTRILEITTEYLSQNPEERLSINVSPLTLESPDWLGTLAGHLGSRPGVASRLILEVTETVAVHDPQATRIRLDAMKALGVAIAIDDFGAGHTSFKHLRNFPVDILKIDGAFVQNLMRSPDDRFFVRTLVDLANHLGVSTVAEWVEDEETASLLADWGVDYLQGDHCGRPQLVEPANLNLELNLDPALVDPALQAARSGLLTRRA